MDKVLTGIVADVALKYNTNIQEVEKVLNMPYKMMRENIQALELRGHLYEEIKDQKLNFNMPILFKLHLNKYKLDKFNSKKNEEINTTVTLDDSSDLV